MRELRACNICGLRPGKFVCKHCGANVCEDCFDPKSGLCKRCRP